MPIRLDDYFDDVPEQPVERPEDRKEQPTPKPDPDREYRIDFIMPGSRRRKRRLVKALVGLAAVFCAAVIVHHVFFAKKASDGRVRGYVVAIEKSEGVVFDSYECTMVVDYPDEAADSAGLIFRFSTTNQAVGKRLYHAMKGDSVVIVDYARYTTAMPWRGESAVVVDDALVAHSTPVSRTPSQLKTDKSRLPKKK